MVDCETPERVHRGSRAAVGRDAPATANAVTTYKSFINLPFTVNSHFRSVMDHGSRIQVQIRRLGLLFLDFFELP
jgi:hypothetical protein